MTPGFGGETCGVVLKKLVSSWTLCVASSFRFYGFVTLEIVCTELISHKTIFYLKLNAEKIKLFYVYTDMSSSSLAVLRLFILQLQ